MNLARTSSSLLLLSILTLSPRAVAQTQLFEFSGEQFSDLFGMTLAGGADFNADGTDDVLVGGYRGNYGPGGLTGLVRAFSGLDGSLILEIVGSGGTGLGSTVVALEDLDGDGHDDLAAGSAFTEGNRVYSGATGQLLFTLPGNGFSLDVAGDFDGDGTQDILSGSSVYSGLDQSLIQSFPEGIYNVLGDLDGDQVADVVQMTFDGLATVFSGATATPLYSLDGLESRSVRGIGDTDADGAVDLAATVAFDQTYIFSGASGALRYAIPVEASLSLLNPRMAAPMGDLDGDGRSDFLLGGDQASLISGAHGCLLATFPDPVVDGFVVSPAGDLDGDGAQEILLGDPLFHGLSNAGVAGVFRYDGSLGVSFCSATPNSSGAPALMRAGGSAEVAQDNLILTAAPGPADQPGLFFFGDQALQVPFGNGTRCVGGNVSRLAPTTFNAGGCLTAQPSLLQGPLAGQALPGSTWLFQAWFRDPQAGAAAFDLSDGLEVTFQ